MPALVTNNATATLSAGISAVATTITLTTGQGALFPTPSGTSVFYASLVNASNQIEVVKVTARTTDTLTVIRGQDSTTARAYGTGDKLELRPTAALFNAKLDADTAALTYAPLVSPALTGTPTAPTAAIGTNTTQLATTAFVTGQGFAPLASPALTGTPTGPTAASGTNTTQLATTEFVLQNGFPTGTRLAFQQTAAPTFWTKDTTAAIDDSILRLVTGTVGAGGSTAFSSFNSQSSVGATTLAESQIPSHIHGTTLQTGGMAGKTGAAAYGDGATAGGRTGTASAYNSAATGGGGSHTHGITTSIKYYDFIIAVKN